MNKGLDIRLVFPHELWDLKDEICKTFEFIDGNIDKTSPGEVSISLNNDDWPAVALKAMKCNKQRAGFLQEILDKDNKHNLLIAVSEQRSDLDFISCYVLHDTIETRRAFGYLTMARYGFNERFI